MVLFLLLFTCSLATLVIITDVFDDILIVGIATAIRLQRYAHNTLIDFPFY